MRSIRAYLLIGFAVAVAGGLPAQEVSPPRHAKDIETGAANAFGRGSDALTAGARILVAPVVAAGITSLRDSAIARGVEPVPSSIRDALLGYVPLDVLDDVRWRIDDSLSAQHTMFVLSDTPAMTLGHVVVFARAADAGDATLWAHELFHAMQFQRWGIEGFVERYLADYGAVEFEAAEFRWQWMKATGRTPKH